MIFLHAQSAMIAIAAIARQRHMRITLHRSITHMKDRKMISLIALLVARKG